MTVENEVRALNEKRMEIWRAVKALLSGEQAQRSGLDAEGTQTVDAAMAEITRIDKERAELLASDDAKEEVARANDAYASILSSGRSVERTALMVSTANLRRHADALARGETFSAL